MSFSSAMITGASGFLGRALAAHLLDQHKRVIVAGRPGGSALPNAHRAIRIANPNAHSLGAALEKEPIDIVFHCAAAGVAPGSRTPDELFGTNVAGAGNWVAAAAEIGARAIVYLGSCSEYGRPPYNIWVAEDQPLAAVDLYGASKAAGGQWGRAVAQRYGIPFLWLRLFGVFGPGEAPHRLLPYLYSRLCAGKRVDLTPGLQWRDFLHVDDAVRGIALAGDLALEGKLGPFNLCSGRAMTVRAFAETVAAAIGGSAIDRLDFGARDYRPDEEMWMVGDPSKFRSATGFFPSLDLEAGITRTIRALGGSTLASRFEQPYLPENPP
jgi:UDP-glucose 4-epimerase